MKKLSTMVKPLLIMFVTTVLITAVVFMIMPKASCIMSLEEVKKTLMSPGPTTLTPELTQSVLSAAMNTLTEMSASEVSDLSYVSAVGSMSSLVCFLASLNKMVLEMMLGKITVTSQPELADVLLDAVKDLEKFKHTYEMASEWESIHPGATSSTLYEKKSCVSMVLEHMKDWKKAGEEFAATIPNLTPKAMSALTETKTVVSMKLEHSITGVMPEPDHKSVQMLYTSHEGGETSCLLTTDKEKQLVSNALNLDLKEAKEYFLLKPKVETSHPTPGEGVLTKTFLATEQTHLTSAFSEELIKK